MEERNDSERRQTRRTFPKDFGVLGVLGALAVQSF
jgi:hypothetical protein